jgi:hypothetical protein
MRKTLILGTALLLSTTALGVTLANASHSRSGERGDAAADRTDARERIVLASDDRDNGHGSRHHRRYAEQDDEDDDGDEGGRGAGSGRPAAPDPNAPVPDNGLFNGKARPKVDVQ